MKYIYKSRTTLFFGLFALFGYSQISTTPVEITSPAPSVANLMSFAEIPVNTHTGVPDISIPLASLPTHNKEINVNVALSYHPSGVAIASKASDVGMGWNLTADAVISRSILNTPDEYLIPLYQSLDPNIDLTGLKYNDVYSYNFMGYSGKFRILYDGSNNTFSLQKLQEDNLKIEFNMISGTQKIESFVVYDDKGFKYTFDVKDKDKRYLRNLITSAVLTNPNGTNDYILSEEYLNSEYYFCSAHHLSKVTDNNGKELVNYTYEEFIEPHPTTPHPATNLITNKVSEIHAVDNGKILFNFDYIPSLKYTHNDPIQLQNIEVKNLFNNTIKKFDFNYGFLNVTLGITDVKSRRYLDKLIENNTISTENNEYNFEYKNVVNNTNPFFCSTTYYGLDTFGYLTNTIDKNSLVDPSEIDIDYVLDLDRPSKEACVFGILERILYPTGGQVKYEFESNTYSYADSQSDLFNGVPIAAIYKAKNFDNHIYTELYNSNYNTSNLNSIPLTLTGTLPVKLYFKLLSNPYYSQLNDPVNEPLYATCRLIGNGVNFYIDNYSLSCLGDYIEVQPGNYTIQINTIGNESATGHLKVTKKETTTQPIKEWVYGGGLRIKKISHYNSHSLLQSPVKEMNYDYQMFDNSNRSSGELYDGHLRNFSTGVATSPQVSYRNVKIFNTLNNGYIKHTYDSFTDSPYFINTGSFTYYQNYYGYKNGLLKKTEFYNASNVLLKTIDNEYDFEERGNLMYITSMINLGSRGFTTKPVWTKLTATNTKEYSYQSGTTKIALTSQTFSYNPTNLKISESTITNSNGEVLKSKYFYHRGVATIYSQNRIGEIESMETYRGAELLSKSKVNYGNVWQNNISFLPQSIATLRGANTLENRLEYKQYDEFSNPLEVQQESGIPITYIWGYNKTQPIAKIENATYAEVQQYEANLQTLSNGTDEANLITALDNLRTALPNAMVTTYTYKPLVGISTVTDPTGNKMTYHYDSFNRLQFVKDKNDHILSDNKYYYKN
ncbi:hypothetical protein [Flavobacterium sp. HNIBRBA15423]|uniref:hypothetical protein n=1 Tax=Flavobacterium sp. HNIBRBA15423 TaxID=3458683 RepID=UPI004044360C